MKTRNNDCDECSKFTRPSAAQWDEWASNMAQTHVQVRCPSCRLWTLWQLKEKVNPDDALAGKTDLVGRRKEWK